VIQLISFYIFASIVIAAAAMVIFARNPVHSVLWLIVAFFNAAGLMVLIVADIDFAELRAGFVKNVPLGILLAVVLVAELVLGIGAYQAGAVKLGTPGAGGATVSATVPNIEAIGGLLYSKYVFLFETAGLILLVAMVGAIVLTHRRSHGTRGQNISSQVQRRPEDATRNVNQPVGQGIEL
jgi:NADH-quinone oxidoreductase subunit J